MAILPRKPKDFATLTTGPKDARGHVKQRQFIDSGLPGLSLRVGSQRRAWTLTYRFAGMSNKVVLGHWPDMSLSTARTKAAEVQDGLKQGIDPAVKRKANAASAQWTFKAARAEFLRVRGAERRDSTLQNYKAVLTREDVKRLEDRPMLSITWGDVLRVSDALRVQKKRAMAGQVEAIFTGFLHFCAARGWVSTDWDRAKRRHAGRQVADKPRGRTRTLSDPEIWTFWNNLEKAPMTDGAKLLLRLVFVTAQRPSDWRLACWKDIDWKATTLVIAADRYKTGVQHTVPLSTLAMELLFDVAFVTQDEAAYVCSPDGGRRCYNRSALTACLRRWFKAQPKLFVKHFTVHDLRRTARALMSRIGVDRETAERVLGHQIGSRVEQTYDTYDYLSEKRDAVETLAGYIRNVTLDIFA